MKERNYLIDSFRLISSLFVIALHVPIQNYNYELALHVRLLLKWAVPFFFMISGYFVSLKVKDNEVYFFNYIVKLLGIILIASIIYFPFGIKEYGFGFFIYKYEWIFHGAYYHLWFLSALLFATLIFSVFYINNLKKILDVFSIFLMLFFVTIMGYGYLFNVHINQSVPLFFLSIFFFNFGSHLDNLFSNTRKSKIISIILLISGILIQEFEVSFLEEKSYYGAIDFHMLFGTVIFSIGVIGCCFSFLQTKSNIFSKYGRKYALFIYVYHVLLVEFFKFINVSGISLLFLPFIILVITLLLAMFLERKMPKMYKILNGQFK